MTKITFITDQTTKEMLELGFLKNDLRKALDKLRKNGKENKKKN